MRFDWLDDSVMMDDKDAARAMLERDVLARALGDVLLERLGDVEEERLCRMIRSREHRLLVEIKAVLDDPTMEDGACFAGIETIVTAFEKQGISIQRHDFG